MPYLEWSDELSVQVRELDEQHKQLLAMINRLRDALLANRGREIRKELVAEVADYVVEHFAAEEQYMQLFNYSGYQEHRQEHEQFAAEALDLKRRVDRGLPVLSQELLTLLQGWLNNHIKGTDKKYSECFNAHGLH